jgi:two-component system, cell cycle sensor histidine kinase and response regulator CckA
MLLVQKPKLAHRSIECKPVSLLEMSKQDHSLESPRRLITLGWTPQPRPVFCLLQCDHRGAMTVGTGNPFDQGRLDLLEQIGRALGGVHGHESVVRAVALAVIPKLADLIAVLTVEEPGEERLQVRHADPFAERKASELLRPLLPVIRKVAMRHGANRREFRWLPQVNDISLGFLAREPQLIGVIHELGIRSLIVVPLRNSGRVIGGLALARTGNLPYHAADLAIAQVLARRIASAIQDSRLYEQAQDERTRRARMEAALRKWVRVFDLAGWGAAIVDGSDYRMEVVNPAFAQQHGYDDPAALAGRLYTDLLPADQSDEPLQWSGVQPRPTESAHVRADGTVFPVLTSVTPLQMEGDTQSYVVTLQDLTDLKRAEERLRRAQRLEAVGRLAGGVAHEVNNMMTIILGFSDLLSRSGALAPERQRDLEEIRKAANRAGKTTQQLLAFSRQQILQPNDLDLNAVVKDLVPTLELLLPANISLETSLAPVGARVHADRAQLDQVLINLAFNGRDAMPGGGLLRLITDSRWLNPESGRELIGIPIPAGQYGIVSVIDTGHGMDQATVTQVFEPFFTTKPVGSGTGLGLATVYGIVKQSGGYVWVDSTPGQGTTVTVCLPQLQNVAGDADRPKDEQVGLEACRSGTILLLEDEDGVRSLARRVLEQQGHHVLEARDGPEALDLLGRHAADLDLVLSDVIVPEIGTNDLENDLRRHRPDLPILYMSGYSRDEMVERGLVPSGGAFLQKPFTAEELGQLVCRQMEGARARGEKVNT